MGQIERGVVGHDRCDAHDSSSSTSRACVFATRVGFFGVTMMTQQLLGVSDPAAHEVHGHATARVCVRARMSILGARARPSPCAGLTHVVILVLVVLGGATHGCVALHGSDTHPGCELTSASRLRVQRWFRGEGDLSASDIECELRATFAETASYAGAIAGAVYGVADAIHRGNSWWQAMINGAATAVAGGVVGNVAGDAAGQIVVAWSGGDFFGGGSGNLDRGHVLRKCRAQFGMGPGATPREIRTAYRRTAINFHPDKDGGSQEAMVFHSLCKEVLLQAAAGARGR